MTLYLKQFHRLMTFNVNFVPQSWDIAVYNRFHKENSLQKFLQLLQGIKLKWNLRSHNLRYLVPIEYTYIERSESIPVPY